MVPADVGPVANALATARRRATIVLQGEVQGRYSTSRSNPDVGSTQTFTGLGTVLPLAQGQGRGQGLVRANGTLQLLGFIAQGRASGSLTLRGARGSVVLALEGPVQRGFSPAPTLLSYQIVSGSGRFAHVKGSGRIALLETSAVQPVPIPGKPMALFINPALFRMVFLPGGVA
jgi:hypothetical protein